MSVEELIERLRAVRVNGGHGEGWSTPQCNAEAADLLTALIAEREAREAFSNLVGHDDDAPVVERLIEAKARVDEIIGRISAWRRCMEIER